jgi:GNAT superfamily N-acetyltransferase
VPIEVVRRRHIGFGWERVCDAFGVIIVRVSRRDDGPALQEIERLAGERFRAVGLYGVADDEPASVDELADYAAQGRGWVAVDAADRPVGYVVVDEVDGSAHVEQVSVRPDYHVLGVGRALLDRVRVWAIETGRSAISLTTFGEVPWNRPVYEHLGFRVLAEDEIGPELRAVRDAETAHGLDPSIRVCMRLDIDADRMDRV